MSDTPLAIVPSYARTDADLQLLEACLRTMKATAHCQALIVDDHSPMGSETEDLAGRFGASFYRQPKNGGFAKAVNVGLQVCLDERRDGILVNSDVEFMEDSRWLEAMQETDADVVGALLLYPNKRVQAAGDYFSPLTRGWFHRFQHAPLDIAELWDPHEGPCTAALQYIRLETLKTVGLYDEEYELAFEDVDYALKVFAAGKRVVYQPRAMAFHHESMTRGDGHKRDEEYRSLVRLIEQHPVSECVRFTP